MRRALIMLAVVLCLGAMMLAGGEVMGASGRMPAFSLINSGVSVPHAWMLEDGEGNKIEYIENINNSIARRYASGRYSGEVVGVSADKFIIYNPSGEVEFEANALRRSLFEVCNKYGEREYYAEIISINVTIITKIRNGDKYYLLSL